MNKLYKKLNFLIVTVLLIGTAICMIYDHRLDRLPSYLAVIPIVLVPTIVNKFIYKTTEWENFTYYVFILLSYFLGCSVNLYNKTQYYDSIVHFISGIYTMYIALNICKLEKVNNNIVKIIFCFGLLFLVAGVWEMLEYGMDVIFKTNLQHNIEEGVKDTMNDQILATLGGTIIYLTSLIKCTEKRKKFKKL